ncbi:MAG TPA: glycosyltransferase family 39 protein [Candidatus Limnocylindrales bacterium]|nr:glycosyltransferase family 39 protein [Candidatus Limnocylindrales bacterium]
MVPDSASRQVIRPASDDTRRALLAVAVAVFAAWSWLAHGGLSSPAFDVDSFDYAQMARQLYRGQGFTMQQTFPYVLHFLSAHGVATEPPWPDTTRFPLIAVEEAAAFAVVGPDDRGILVAGGALLVATVVAVFLLAGRLFGISAGVLAALAVAAEAEQLRLSRSGLLETGSGLFIVLAALALVASTESARSRSASLLGILLGLAFLQRYDLLALAPVAAVLLVVRREDQRSPSMLWCTAGFVLAAGPWLVRNLLTIGTLLGSTSVDRNLLGGIVPGDVYMAPQTLSAWQVALENLPALSAKLVTGATWIGEHAGEMFGGRFATCAALAAAALPIVSRSRAAATAWLFAAGALAARALLLSLMHNELRFYASFTPLLIVLAVGAAITLLRRISSRARTAEPAIAAFAFAAMAFTLPPLPASRSFPPPEPFASLRQLVPAGAVVASDASWNVAWYSDLPSVRFSGQWPELAGTEQAGVRVGAVLVRGPYAREFEAGHERAGGGLFRAGPGLPGGYRLWLRIDGSASLVPAPPGPAASPGTTPEATTRAASLGYSSSLS